MSLLFWGKGRCARNSISKTKDTSQHVLHRRATHQISQKNNNSKTTKYNPNIIPKSSQNRAGGLRKMVPKSMHKTNATNIIKKYMNI